MAARLSAVQKRQQMAFMKELFEWGDFASRAEWARAARYPSTNLSNVMNGKAGIEGLNLIRLYRAAESRAAENQRSGEGSPSAAKAPTAVLAGPEAAVAALMAEVRAGFEKLDARLAKLEPGRTPELAQPRSKEDQPRRKTG